MSILINGMEMPTGNNAVSIIIFPNGKVSLAHDHRFAEYAEAVPVPPHGRLIDANALADIFRGFIAAYDSCPFSQLSLPDKARRDELQSALAEVIYAPTIIPAEGEDRNVE